MGLWSVGWLGANFRMVVEEEEKMGVFAGLKGNACSCVCLCLYCDYVRTSLILKIRLFPQKMYVPPSSAHFTAHTFKPNPMGFKFYLFPTECQFCCKIQTTVVSWAHDRSKAGEILVVIPSHCNVGLGRRKDVTIVLGSYFCAFGFWVLGHTHAKIDR